MPSNDIRVPSIVAPVDRMVLGTGSARYNSNRVNGNVTPSRTYTDVTMDNRKNHCFEGSEE